MTSRTATVRRPSAAALLATAALLLAGCGSAPDPATEPPPGTVPAAPPATAPRVEASTAGPHAAFFAEVAARCAGATAPPASASAGTGAAPQDPESRKYAENHAYRQQTELSPAARCRGEAHAARIRAALAATPVTGAAELTALLRGLGYPAGGGDVFEGSGAGGPGFALPVPGGGPCVSGRAGTPARVETHGVYLEGGCKEPTGGH
ncbi:hypothetical protein AB0D45_08790 [Streptomyces sp. NPDC048352]|uniref:hypothetical protein n=1 Tax=Streptomyces sp. NPDC048352 TaxID=3154718 RepID=UPI0034156FE0